MTRLSDSVLVERLDRLNDRIEKLEFQVYKQWVERCPRCEWQSMHEHQPGICARCAYKLGDDPELEKE